VTPRELSQLVMQRMDALARISEEEGKLTRTFASPAMREANNLVASWMIEAGMAVRTDAIGNLIGHYAGATPEAKILLLGSHLDTVRDAGKFDGPLGVLVAIASVQRLNEHKRRLPFAIEVVGFADEEGGRFHSTYLGSRALAGTFKPEDLECTDSHGVILADAIREFGGDPTAIRWAKADPRQILGYVEVHIEQGPVLEQRNLAVGVVSAIAGQTRAKLSFVGQAGHAGTVPMELRRDALCAAAEFIALAEAAAHECAGLVATIGQLTVLPGASNVIPGEAHLTLDVRHSEDAVRERFCAELKVRADQIAAARGVSLLCEIVQQSPAVACDVRLSARLESAVRRHQSEVPLLTSGAGHDAVAMSAIAPVAMLFVRCKGGISHHPAESVMESDVGVATEVMHEFISELASGMEK
jgi:allantoate deiminase